MKKGKGVRETKRYKNKIDWKRIQQKKEGKTGTEV
jgi:hypothetical protein